MTRYSYEQTPITAHIVAERRPDGRCFVQPYDIYEGDKPGELRVGNLRAVPLEVADEASAILMAGVMNDPYLMIMSVNWSQEKWDQVLTNIREQLKKNRDAQDPKQVSQR